MPCRQRCLRIQKHKLITEGNANETLGNGRVYPGNLGGAYGLCQYGGQTNGISRETEIRRLDKSTFNVTKHKHDFWIKEWQRLPGGDIVMTRQNGLSLYRSSSSDGGRSWTHDKMPSNGSTYWMDPRRAYSLEYKPGFNTVSNTLRKTVDRGGSWNVPGVPLVTQSFGGNIVYADGEEVIVQSLGMVYTTRDEGKSWTRIFPPKP